MESVLGPGVQVGAVGVLLVLLIRTYWRQGASWERIVQAERDAVTQAREDAAAARAEVAEVRKSAADAERRCKEEIAALRRRIEELERG